MAISPAVDHRNQNPQIDAVDPSDPILSRKVIEDVSEGWRGDWPSSDPRISPLLADLKPLQQADVKVDGVIALHDVLSPDAIEFRNRLAECGVVGQWLEWEKVNALLPTHVFTPRARNYCWKGLDWDFLRRRAQSP
jgi:acetyl esterase/lipase